MGLTESRREGEGGSRETGNPAGGEGQCWAGQCGRVEATGIKGGANRIFGLTGVGCNRKIKDDPKFFGLMC